MEFRQGLAIGAVVGGDYRIVDVLGQGGFGLTYKGFDNRLGAAVAIKEYFPADMAVRQDGASVHVRSTREEGVFAWGREKFLEEAKTLARFRHNNIVRVARLFEENNTAYMVLDFEEGPSLSQWRDRLGRPPRQDELDRIATRLLDAVAVVHAGGILHRDIKPQNIIMRNGTEPVLIDFGAARASLGQRSKTVHAIVTPGYSPKEQYALDVDRQGPWTDIYAVGATLYFLVTGQSPPDALTRDLQDAMPMQTDGVEPYRDAFLDAIDAAMQVRAEDRPQSVEEWRPMLFGDARTVVAPQRPRPPAVAPTVLSPASRRTGQANVASRRQSLVSATEPGQRPLSFDEIKSPPQPVERRSFAGPLIGTGAIALVAAAGFAYFTLVIDPGRDDAAWAAAVGSNTLQSYDAYLARRPNGRFAAEARQRRERIVLATPGQTGPANPPVPPTPTVNPTLPPAPPQPTQPDRPPPSPPQPEPKAGPAPTPPPQPDSPQQQQAGPQTPAQPSEPQPQPQPTQRRTRPPLPPRALPAPLQTAELQRLQTSVAAGRWRFAPFSTSRVPGLSGQNTDFIAEVASLSGGRMVINAIDPQEVGGANRMLTEVLQQHDLMGWHTPLQSQARNRAYLIFQGAVPFGLGPADHVRWLRADGARLLEQLYLRDRFPVRAIPCGIAGQPGAWYRREIRSPSDFRALKVRSIGFASDVLQRLGAQGGGGQTNDLAAAFAANTVDAALFSSSLLATFAKSPPPARVFHYPSWHAPAYLFELVMSPELWTSLSEDQQKLIDEACRRNLDKWAVQFASTQNEVLTQVRNAGVIIRPHTAPTLEALRKATDEVLKEEADKNSDFKLILDSYNQFRRPQ